MNKKKILNFAFVSSAELWRSRRVFSAEEGVPPKILQMILGSRNTTS